LLQQFRRLLDLDLAGGDLCQEFLFVHDALLQKSGGGKLTASNRITEAG
jgi:hypothetical protein